MRTDDAQEGMYSHLSPMRVELRQWRVAAASICGTSHAKTGQPCQDTHWWAVLPHSTLVAAVADGAGSAARAEVGAAIAVRTAVATLHARLPLVPLPHEDSGWRTLLTEAMQAARTALDAEALERAIQVRDLATTLILLAATPQIVAVIQIGDGAAVVSDHTGKILALTAPQSGEYLNETTFLVSPGAVETAQVMIWHGTPSHIALLTDGLQMLALNTPAGIPHAPFFSPLFRFVTDMTDAIVVKEKLAAFLESPRVMERTNDDLTLLLAALVD